MNRRTTLVEVRKLVQAILLEALSDNDYNQILRKILRLLPLTVEDIAIFAEMCIDFYAEDTLIAPAPELVRNGWDLLLKLTQSEDPSMNRQGNVTKLRGVVMQLGKTRKNLASTSDLARVEEEADVPIARFLQNEVENWAKQIVKGYNKDVVKELTDLDKEKETQRKETHRNQIDAQIRRARSNDVEEDTPTNPGRKFQTATTKTPKSPKRT